MNMKRKNYIHALLKISAFLLIILLINFSILYSPEKSEARENIIKGKSILEPVFSETAVYQTQQKHSALPIYYKNKNINIDNCENLVNKTLFALPENHVSGLQKITLVGSKMERRGYGGYGSIDIQCVDIDEPELIGVLVHEMGHIVDSDFLVPESGQFTASAFTDFDRFIPTNDQSVDFYSISWIDSGKKKSGSTKFDFVSVYAMTDPFEDFAETYLMYILHGKQFKTMAESNSRLFEKYNFMKNEVFSGQEFDNDIKHINTKVRIYDSTRLKFSLDKFFKIE